MRRIGASLAGVLFALVLFFAARVAMAQFPIGPTPQAAPKPAPGQPETHAASGASESGLPKTEAQLPEDPLAIPEEAKKRIGTNRVPDDDPQGTKGKKDVDFYGLYYSESDGDYTFRTAFPFWAERTQPGDRASLFGLYYQRRSVHMDADVAFPF
ncbi:MAG: hypothetical protein HOV80_37025, partial [Polyangiaceae bacterium]|nr:hypothetical protein [Polyangiaceae bacterium]